MSNAKAMTKRELIREISDVTQLKPDIVKGVIDTFSDILIREAVMTGSFNLANCFTIRPVKRSARTQYNVHKGKSEFFPETTSLQIKLSRKINYYHRWAQRSKYNEEHGLTPEDWNKR